MRILSFDVGTRNLAYAKLEWKPPSDPDSDTENVEPEEEALSKHPEFDGDTLEWKPASDPVETEEEASEKEEALSKHPEVSEWESFRILAWERIDILADNAKMMKNSKSVSLEKILAMLFQSLCKRAETWQDPELDFIVIERQMRNAPRNLMVSSAMIAFFMLKRPEVPVSLIAATGKLKVNIQQDKFAFTKTSPPTFHFQNDSSLTGAQNSKLRKKKAVQVLDVVLKECVSEKAQREPVNCRRLLYLNRLKKDDLADCFLQGLYFLQWKNAPNGSTKHKRKMKQDTESKKRAKVAP